MTPEQVAARLVDLPPATLVLGPGAWPLVRSSAGPGWMLQDDMSADVARRLHGTAWLLPTVGGFRIMALNMTGASAQVQNMLLKVLEEPPDSTKFVLAAESRPLPTVLSRCRVLVLGREVAGELPDPKDMAAVASALRVARSGRTALLAQNLRGWLPATAGLLGQWAAEAATGRWRVFGPETAPGVSSGQAMRLLAELARYPGTRLGPLAALQAVFSPE